MYTARESLVAVEAKRSSLAKQHAQIEAEWERLASSYETSLVDLNKEYERLPLFVNSDAFVNTARLHTHVPLECSWYDSYQHWWCVQFERLRSSLCAPFFTSVCDVHTDSPSCSQTHGHGPRYAQRVESLQTDNDELREQLEVAQRASLTQQEAHAAELEIARDRSVCALVLSNGLCLRHRNVQCVMSTPFSYCLMRAMLSLSSFCQVRKAHVRSEQAQESVCLRGVHGGPTRDVGC
jgi:hypothetical protein